MTTHNLVDNDTHTDELSVIISALNPDSPRDIKMGDDNDVLVVNTQEILDSDDGKNKETTYSDRKNEAYLSSGRIMKNFHKSKTCKGNPCPVHNPSNHKYRDLDLDFVRGMFVRITDKSRYGFIPDPDDQKSRTGKRIILKNSLLCYNCDTEVESTHLNDYARCKCDYGTFIVANGGHESLKRVLSYDAKYSDTSIVFLPRPRKGKS